MLVSDSGDSGSSDREAEDEGIERDQDENGFRRSGICQKIFQVRLRSGQCVQMQMAGLFFNILPFTIMKICTKIKSVQNVAKQKINHKKFCRNYLPLAKVAKFCQIWSHWIGHIVFKWVNPGLFLFIFVLFTFQFK